MILILCFTFFALGGFFFGVAWCRRPTILKPSNERPFTSDELKQMGIVAPERYDCETFVR
jgi:hypothetical protein